MQLHNLCISSKHPPPPSRNCLFSLPCFTCQQVQYIQTSPIGGKTGSVSNHDKGGFTCSFFDSRQKCVYFTYNVGGVENVIVCLALVVDKSKVVSITTTVLFVWRKNVDFEGMIARFRDFFHIYVNEGFILEEKGEMLNEKTYVNASFTLTRLR